MFPCPSCGSAVPEGNRFCGGCGTATPPPASGTLRVDAPTSTSVPSKAPGADQAPPTASVRPAPHSMNVSGLGARASLDQSRFLPGTMIAERYRVIGMLGRGGMGEVYRADDLKLGQPVALKFLPPAFERDENRLTRFLNEVRTARQVTHANVCRVYDVGDVDGQQFISMEYVDGEDLATLLRRIGRLPRDKAVQIARQICAGLAAAHEQGILHRDLKPANIMLDGRGHVKITDFGLAGLADEFRGAEVRAGTPTYMAPEQLAGREVTVRSDLYALGLLLYELFTGKIAFEAQSLEDLQRLQQTSIPTSPSSHVEGFDPAVERVILRCLEKEPRDRPASALAIAAALPGGDPLAAALAAGETPSPEMVADAAVDGGLRPAVAVACLVLILLAIPVRIALGPGQSLLGRVPLEKPPAVLAERARTILADLGHTDPPADSAHGFYSRGGYLEHIEETDESTDRWERLGESRPAAVGYWYRQSPRHLIKRAPDARVWSGDPPRTISGMANVWLDTEGRLLGLTVVPPQKDESEGPDVDPDWSALFDAADLDMAAFTPVRSTWVPEVYSDARAAWEGAYPERPDDPLRLEAAAYRGQIVSFDHIEPWDKPTRMQEDETETSDLIGQAFFLSIFIAICTGAILLARHNIRLGRGDRKGAFRVGLFVTLLWFVSWIFDADHVPDFDEFNLVILAVSASLFTGGLVWVSYMALEPFVRRWWPDSIVSWSRLLAGRFRDPMIGRDLLIGGSFGVVLNIVFTVIHELPEWAGLPARRPGGVEANVLQGGRRFIGEIVALPLDAIIPPLMILFFILLLRVVLRKMWIVSVVFMLLFGLLQLLNTLGEPTMFMDIGFGLFVAVLWLVILTRFGILTFCFAGTIGMLTGDFGLSAGLTTWYSGYGIAATAIALALVGYGFRTSLAGRSILKDETLER